MTRRVVTKTTEEILVRWCADGPGGRPRLLTEEKECPSSRLVEMWVPIEKTFIDNGQRYFWLTIGHGEYVRVPVDD